MSNIYNTYGITGFVDEAHAALWLDAYEPEQYKGKSVYDGRVASYNENYARLNDNAKKIVDAIRAHPEYDASKPERFRTKIVNNDVSILPNRSVFDFDKSGHVDALTDGLMYLRYLFNLRGDSLTKGAISDDSHMTSEQVAWHIEQLIGTGYNNDEPENARIGNMLDIDGDGNIDALTDGLMLLRYLFNLRGDSLTKGAIGPDSPHRDLPKEQADLSFIQRQGIEALMPQEGQERILLDVNGNVVMPDGPMKFAPKAGDGPFEEDPTIDQDWIESNFGADADFAVAPDLEDYDLTPEPEPEPEPEPTPTPTPEPTPVEVAEGPFSPLDIDQDGTTDALTDGLMMLRYLFNLRGDSLVSGAVKDNAARKSADEIEAYFAKAFDPSNKGLFNAFDFDQSGDIDALTDGLMYLRYLFNLRGDSLTKGATKRYGDDIPPDAFNDEIELLFKSLVSKSRTSPEDIITVAEDGVTLNKPSNEQTDKLVDADFFDGYLTGDVGQNAEFPTSGEDDAADYDDLAKLKQILSQTFENDEETLYEASLRGVSNEDLALVYLNLANANKIYSIEEIASDLGMSAELLLARFSVSDSESFPTNDGLKVLQGNFGPQAEIAEQTEIDARQQALDNYTGEGFLPEGYGEEQIRKRFEYWRDNPLTTAEQMDYEIRATEASEIRSTNPEAYAAVAKDFNRDGGDAGINDLDFFDAFPDDASETLDSDNDGVGNNADVFPLDASETIDLDNDGVGANADPDDNNADIKTEVDILETIDTDGDGTPDYRDELPEDPKYTTTQARDEQKGMDKFLLNNSRVLIGAHAVGEYEKLTSSFNFDRPGVKEFLEWRERYVNNTGKMPNMERVNEWLRDKDWRTSSGGRNPVYTNNDKAKAVSALVAIEGSFFTDHRISERTDRMEAVTDWQTDDIGGNYFEFVASQGGLKSAEGYEDVADTIEEYAEERRKRHEEIELFIKHAEDYWKSEGMDAALANASEDGPHSETPYYLRASWLNRWQNGSFLMPPSETLQQMLNSGLTMEEIMEQHAVPLHGPRAFEKEFKEEFGQERWDTFNASFGGSRREDGTYEGLIYHPLGTYDFNNSYDLSEAQDLYANEENYIWNKEEEFNAAYQESFQFEDADKQKIVDQYTESVPVVIDAIDAGSTPSDIQQLINLGASKRLGDLWRENPDEEAFFAAIEEYNVDAFIELPIPLRDIEGTPRGYDADRLYMKMPGDDDIVLRGTGNYETRDLLPMNNPEIRAKFANADDFPDKIGTGKHEDDNVGYYVDISGGEAEVGDYTMVWVKLPKEPNWLEKGLSELGPITDIIQAALSIFGGPPGVKLAMQIEAAQVGLKILATGEIEPEDFTSLILYGLVELGQITLPVDEAAAQAAGEAARPAAEAAAKAKGLIENTDAFATFVEGKVAAEVNLALTGVGIAGLSANQTIAVIKAAGSGNIEDVIFPILGELGGDWIQNSLRSLGVSESAISGLSQSQLDAMYSVVGKMATGDSFEEAITEEVLAYFDDAFNISGQAKGFFEDFKSDLQNIMRVAEEFIDNPALADFGEFIVGTMEDLDIDEYLQQVEELFDGSIESVEKIFDELDIVLDFSKDTVESVAGVIDQMVAPLVANAKIQYDKLPDDVQAKIEKLTNDLDQFVGGPFTNLEPAVKEAVKQGMVQRLLGVDGDSLEGEAAIRNAFTRELITVETIASIDNTVVDVLSPGALATALRAGLNTMLAGQPDADEAMVRAFAQYVKKGIERSIDAGTFAEDFQSWWDKAGTAFEKFEAEEEKVKDVQDRGVAAGTELKNAKAAKKELEKSLEDARTAAMAPDATDREKQAYIDMMSNDSTYRDDLIAANDRIKAANDAILALEIEEAEVLEGYNAARSELSLSNQLKEPTVEAYTRVLDTGMAEAIDENFNDHVYAQMYNIPEGMTPSQYFLQVGAEAGHATTVDEFNDRIKTGSSEFAMNTLRSAGIDVTKMTDEERQGVTNYLTGTWAKDKAAELGITELEYIEQFNKDFDADFGSADEAAAFITEAMGTPPEQVASTIAKRRSDRAFDLLGTSYAEMGDILNNEVSYTFDSDTGKIVWGGDGFMKREWDDASGKFVTYQYDMGGAMRYQLNEDGSTPVVPTYEQTSMFRGIDSLAEDDPVAYMTVIASAPPALSELSLLRRTLFEEIAANPDYVDTEGFQLRIDELTAKVENATEDSDYAVPNEDLTYFQRIARDATKKAQDAITAAELEVFELGKVPNRNPEQEKQLTEAVERLRDAEDNLDTVANWAIRLPSMSAMGINTMVRGIGTALSDAFVNAPMYEQIRINAILAARDPDNPNIKTNQEIKDAWYGDPDNWISREFDYSTVVNNDFNTNMLGVESIGYAALPESYRNDVTDFWTDVETAEGIGGKLEALYNGFKDKPDVFLTEVIGMELGQELIGLFGGLGIAKITTKAAMLANSAEVAQALGRKAGMATNTLVELGDSFGQVVLGSYEEAYAELKRIGYSDADAEAKAVEIAMSNGAMSVLLTSAVPGARALDNKVLSPAGNRALNTLAERFVDGAGVVGKETLNEIFQELGTGIHFESAMYNAGVEDRDYAGNLTVSTALAAVVSPMVTTSIYGLSIPAQGVEGSSNNPITGEFMKSPKVQELVLAGDSAGLNQYMSDLGFANDNIIFVDVMDTVDDANYVTVDEARDVYEYYGVEPDGDDLLAISGQGNEDTAMLEAEAYWTARYGEDSFGTGRTTAQHYDIIQHLTDMIDGKVPLDSAFNQNGDMTLSLADVDQYMANMSQYERDQLANYDASNHQPTGIIEEMGGSIMTTEELQKLQTDIQTLLDRPNPPEPQEIVDLLLADPENKGLLAGVITAAIGVELEKKATQEAFANEIVAKLVADGTIETQSEEAIKDVLGDPDAAEAEGIYKIIQDLEAQIGLGDDDPASLTELINEKIGKAGTFVDGEYQNDGTGLLGDLTKQGVSRDVAIETLTAIVGSEGDGTDANPATGLYAIAKDVNAIEDVVTEMNDSYFAALSSLVNNVGRAADDPLNKSGVASGLYAAVAEAINVGTANQELIEGLLGEYTTFAEFKSALDGVLQTRIDETAALLGTPPVYDTDADGNIKRDETTGEPLFVEGGEPTGYHLDMYNAMQLQGEERDAAFGALEVKMNAAIANVESVSSIETARQIKEDILDVYFPAKPADYDAGKEIQDNIDMLQEEEPRYIEYYMDSLTDTEKAALDGYNAWLATPNAITPMLENISNETNVGFESLNRRMDSLQTNVNDYVRDNVVSMIGQPEVTEEEATALNPQRDATGLYALVQEGDQDILDVLGELGTIEDGVLTGGKGILKDMQLLGMSNAEIKSFLDTNLGTPAEGDQNATGLYAAVGANTEALNTLTTAVNNITIPEVDLSGIEGQITDLDSKIGTLPTLVEGTTDQYEGGSGLRLDLFNQGLSIADINAMLGTVDDANSVVGRLEAIKNTADAAATAADLTALDTEVGALTTTIGDTDSGLVKAVNDLSAGAITKDNFGQALVDAGVATTEAVTQAIEGIQFPEVDLSGIEGQITNLDSKIGELPTLVEGTTDQYEGGSGLRLDLFNQGLSIADINAMLGTVDDANSVVGRLEAIKNTADAAATAADLETLDTEVGALTTTIGDTDSGLVKAVNDLSAGAITKDNFGQALVDAGVATTEAVTQAIEGIQFPEVDLSGLATTEQLTEATQDLVTDTELSQAIEGIQFPETDLTGLATTEDVTQAIEGIDFPETDLSGVATVEQAEGIQTSVDQIATLLGKPPNLVTEADVTAVAALIADFEIDSENVAQADMLRYDVNADGIIDTTDQDILQAGFEGDYTGFAPDAQFNQATGMFLQQQQDQETIAAMEQAAIEREAEFLNQMDLQRTQFQQDLDEREEEEKREEYLKAFTAPGRTRTTTTPDDPADIKYFYDIAGDDIFANQEQDKFYGAASPFGDNFMNEILTPPRRKAKGGLIDETDEILKILGE